jgi:glycosyltransferase involved in cell wall biosynthesis
MRVIPNGISTSSERPAGATVVRLEAGVRDGEFLWAAVGRLDEPKDYPNLLRAAAMALKAGERFKILIAGEGPLRHRIEALILSLGLSDAVRLIGLRDDIDSLLAGADALVLSSAWEGLPNVVMEALAAGRPVVTTDVGGVRDLVTDRRTGFVVAPRDPDALCGAMLQMMRLTQHDRCEMGNVGREHIMRHYDAAHVTELWFALFAELLVTRNRRSLAA